MASKAKPLTVVRRRRDCGNPLDNDVLFPPKHEAKRSWWLEHPTREGFTDTARREIKPFRQTAWKGPDTDGVA